MHTVLVETVGVGQVEVEIAGAADTTVVVVTPGGVTPSRPARPGLLEVADIFVVNKADRDGAAETRRDLDNMLDLNPAMGDWRPPVVLTTASTGEGVDLLWVAVHRTTGGYLESSGELATPPPAAPGGRNEPVARPSARTGRAQALAGGAVFQAVTADLLARRLDPYDAAARLLDAERPDEGAPTP